MSTAQVVNAQTTIGSENVIALLGQPNSGKSTLFNGLTGARQHVGNWPGKTVEKKEGTFTYKDRKYKIVDLPGTYSLLANSEEEIVTRDYVVKGNVDVALIMVDASQLERSLFLLADYAGIKVPVIVLLNMMDIASQQGKIIDFDVLSSKLGVPVIPLTASDKKSYISLFENLENLKKNAALLDSKKLDEIYLQKIGQKYKETKEQIEQSFNGKYSATWITSKLFENDQEVKRILKNTFSEEKLGNITRRLGSDVTGSLLTGDCKFEWIRYLLEGAVKKSKNDKGTLSRFDRIATSKRWGKFLAFGIIILGLILSMILAMPIMMLSSMAMSSLPVALSHLLSNIGLPKIIVSLLCDSVLTAAFAAVAMAGYVFGISLVFGFLEEIGYMARVSYVFDNSMSKFGLQGKAVMPFLISFGCNIGGISGTKVIDSWKQKVLTMSMVWIVPCAATWGVIGLLGSVFFGKYAGFVILALFLTAFLHIFITAKLFGGSLLKEEDKAGLIMELPPYHKPNYKNLFKFVVMRMGDVIKKALKLIVLVAVIFWALSYSSDNNIDNSILYRIGTTIEPVTMWFGLRWQTFTAFITSAIGKEAALGVFASLFNNESVNLFNVTMGTSAVSESGLGTALISGLTKPEALAFMFAYFFNVPCLMTVAATYSESHSLSWTAKIAGYYIVMALLLSTIAYHVGLLIF